MNQYELLLSEYENEVDVSEHEMVNEGLYADGFIWIKKNLTTSRKQAILAEEVGHHLTTVGDILDLTDIENARQEHRARVWAYKKLLTDNQILDAAAKGYTRTYDMAEYLNVDEEFLIEYLVHQGILDISL